MTFEYPITKKLDQVADYHGTTVLDPFDGWKNPIQTKQRRNKGRVEAQNKLSFGHLEKLELSEVFEKRLTELWDYEKFTQPNKRGGRYFFTQTTACRTSRSCTR